MGAPLESAIDAQDLANEQRGLLDLVDKLTFAQLDNVKLPQIVVVGDQSAGKSSVLEAITGTPFPRDAGACTRFATEIRLRRSAESTLKVSIIPDRNRSFKEQEGLKQFGGMVDSSLPFETLMRAAVDLIAPKNMPGRFAARDILVVDKRGPDMPLLTLVDLPGLVRNANNEQSLEDLRTIEALSDRYMKSSRTIILAVVGGNSDYVQAPILTKARQFDPNGARTIGVLTKPDLTESIGLEDKFINLVTNKDQRNDFRLGWYVLLNPGPRDPGQPWPSAEERRRIEQDFFGRGKWSTLPENMCGATALKQKLSQQLQRHIGKHVKVLRQQIQDALNKCDAELNSLGEGKDTPEEMRIELVELFSASKELVIPALYGIYKNPPKRNFFRVTADPHGTPAANLRARASEENDRFGLRIRAHGRKFSFTAGEPRTTAGDPSDPKQGFVKQEVEMLLRQIRGSEFPTDPKPRAVYMLFQSYSEYWPKLAQEHKDNLGVVCNEFLGELVDYAWPKRMRDPIRRLFLDPQMRKLMEKATEELDRLTQDMHLEVQPYDPEYEERLRNWHQNGSKDGATFSEAQEVLEKMLIYYELSAKSFIRNVIVQVIERHLLQGMYGLFNSIEVLGMSNDTIEAIAAENKETRDRRQTLKVQKRAIEEAKDICAGLAMRKELRMYAEDVEDNEESSDDERNARSERKPSSPGPPRRPSRAAARDEMATAHSHSNGNGHGNGNGNGNGTYYSPAEKTPASFTYADERSRRPERLDDARNDGGIYTAAPRATPPAPPPRPEKVRGADEYGPASVQRMNQAVAAGDGQQYHQGMSSNNPYVPAEPREVVPPPAEYVSSSRKPVSMRKILGRT